MKNIHALNILLLSLFFYSCSNNDCRDQAFHNLEKKTKEACLSGEKFEINDKEVAYATDSVCVIYYTFHYHGKDEKMEFGYVILPNGLKCAYDNTQGYILSRCDSLLYILPQKTEKDKEHILGYLIGNNGYELK